MSLGDFFVYYPEITDTDFETKLMSKFEMTTAGFEDRLWQKATPYQMVIARFLASKTPYIGMLIVHAMGTGKTCTAVNVIEESKNDYKRAIVLAPNENLISNFKNELVFKCTGGNYVPPNYENLTQEQRIVRLNKMTDYYNFDTYEKFAKHLHSLSDNGITVMYDKSIWVIDEVHLVVSNSLQYTQLWRALHLCPNSKIMLLSGTPMVDSVVDIANVMNLILPVDEQLPTIKFTDHCLTTDGRANWRLFRAFRGRVSYLKSNEKGIEKKYIGQTVGKLKYLPVIVDKMSEYQSKYYYDALLFDESDQGGVYTRSRAADLAAITPGIVVVRTNHITGDDKQVSIAPQHVKQVKPLSALAVISSKYAALIPRLEEAYQQKQCVFVYCTNVTGSGLDFLAALLSQYGWSQASGAETRLGKRFAYLHSGLTRTQLTKIIQRFNKPDNLFGRFIHIIIGSELIATGFSFFNIQHVAVLTPHWNMKKLYQAIARGNRYDSHTELIKAGIKPVYNIYLYVSQAVSKPDTINSISLYMYEIAEQKDIAISKIERDLIEYSFDCNFNITTNISGRDNSADCQYMPCEFRCQGEILPVLDYSSYNLLYTNKLSKRIVTDLIAIFNTTEPPWNFANLHAKFSADKFVVRAALAIIIETQIIIKNSFVLAQDNDLFYLVKPESYNNKYYDYNQILYTHKPARLLIQDYSTTLLVQKLLFSDHLDKDEQEDLFISLDRFIQTKLFEALIIKKYSKDIPKHIITLKQITLSYFENFYNAQDQVHWINFPEIFSLKEYKNITTTELGKKYQKTIEDRLRELESNSYQYYGQYSKIGQNFCIRYVEPIQVKKRHQQTSGKRCQSWDRGDLLRMIVDVFDIQLPPEPQSHYKEIELLSQDELEKRVATTRYNKTQHLSPQKMRQLLYYDEYHPAALCGFIRDFLDSKKLLIEDPSCGTQGKLKPK